MSKNESRLDVAECIFVLRLLLTDIGSTCQTGRFFIVSRLKRVHQSPSTPTCEEFMMGFDCYPALYIDKVDSWEDVETDTKMIEVDAEYIVRNEMDVNVDRKEWWAQQDSGS